MSSLQVIKNRLDRSIRSETGVDHPVLKEGDGHRWPLDLLQPHDLVVTFFFFPGFGVDLTNPAVFNLRRNVIVFYKEIKFLLILWYPLMDTFVSAPSVLHRTFFSIW